MRRSLSVQTCFERVMFFFSEGLGGGADDQDFSFFMDDITSDLICY